jgi:hypothetical protein
MLILHQLQEHDITWEQFLLKNRFIEEKEINTRHDEIKVYEIPTLKEKPISISGKEIIEATKGTRRMTCAMKRKEVEYIEKDNPFASFTRRSRRVIVEEETNIHKAHQIDYDHIETLEIQEKEKK